MHDLGVWIAFQIDVEKMLRFKKRNETETLCGIVNDAWEKLDPAKLENVSTAGRWSSI